MTELTKSLTYPTSPQRRPQLQQPSPGRNLSLDLLKALAILMVIFYHNGQVNPDSIADNLLMLVPNAAVPCFFMASGAIFFHRSFHMKRHFERLFRFYLTIVAWKAIYMALYWHWGAPVNGSLRMILSYLLLFQHLEGVGTAHFWFMDAMLTVMLAAPLLYLCYHDKEMGGCSRLLPGHSRLLLFLLAVLILFNQVPAVGNLMFRLLSQMTGKPGWDISPLGEVNPFSFRYSNYFTYYLLGGLLMESRERISIRLSSLCTILGAAGLLCVKYIQTGSFRWNGIYLESGYYWLSTMAVSAGLFLLTTKATVREHTMAGWIARYPGAYTMGIFYLHIPFLFVLAPVLLTRLQPYNGWLVNLAESCLVILLSLPIIWVGRKIPVIKNLFR